MYDDDAECAGIDFYQQSLKPQQQSSTQTVGSFKLSVMDDWKQSWSSTSADRFPASTASRMYAEKPSARQSRSNDFNLRDLIVAELK